MSRMIQVEQVTRPAQQVSFTSFRRISFDGGQEVQAPSEAVFVEPKPSTRVIPVKAITRRKQKPLSQPERNLLSYLIASTSLY